MEQAASGALSSIFAQLGIFGLVLALIGVGFFWYLRATKDIRDEKEGIIKRLQEENDALEVLLEKYREAYYACKYPGSRPDPFEHDAEGGVQ